MDPLALTAGRLSPERARARLTEYVEHHATTVEVRWALTAAGRYLDTSALNALGQAHSVAQRASIVTSTPPART